MEKNDKVQSIDILFTILNFITMVVVAILFFVNVFLISLSIFSAVVLCGLTLLALSRKNPYYIISCYGLAICGLFFSAGLLLTPEWSFHWSLSILFVVTIILDVYLIASLTRVPEGSWRVKNPWIAYGPLIEPNTDVPRYIKESYEPLGSNKTNKTVIPEQKSAIRKKYHVRWILLTTSISTFIFFSTIVLSFFTLFW